MLVLLFVVCSVAVHAAQPSFNPLEVALSFYMNGAFGWLLGLGLISLGAGSLLLGAAVAITCKLEFSRSALVLLSLWAAACVVGGLFPPDAYGEWDRPPSPSGIAHGVAALFAFVSFPSAALSLSRLPRIAESNLGSDVRRLAAVCAILTLLLVVCFAPVIQHRPPFAFGLVERLALAAYVGWLLLMNRTIRRILAVSAQ